MTDCLNLPLAPSPGSGSDPKLSVRMCVSCRRMAPKSELWRVVRLAGDKVIQLDRGMGRSAYLCQRAACLQEAQKKNRLGRALRSPIPDPIYQALHHRLTAS